ncbi:MAG: 4Fe-4S dicluster domain-containing protein, partial [Asgard group archaeon]|nr:4Fe-4S dicluster domain-containing protein [Asgard group archaeon]
YALENSVIELENSIKFSKESVTRFDIPIEFGRREGVEVPLNSVTIKHILTCIKNMKKAIFDLKKNPINPRKKIEAEELEELEKYVKTVKVSAIGYTKVPPNLIFKNKAIAYENAIVLAMNMDNDIISGAPNKSSLKNIWYTYDKLSVASNKVARFLRKKGFGAHASPPLGGIALYPKLAQEAGMGEFGYSGLLVTPFNGPTCRLAAVYVSIENLPIIEETEHSWIRDYCEQCRRCIKECPPGAIYEHAIEQEAGRLTHIDNEKCFPYFGNNYGCTVCIKVCPFNKTDYNTLKRNFGKQHNS